MPLTSPILNLLLVFCLLAWPGSAASTECPTGTFKVYPLADALLQKTFLLTDHQNSLFLIVTCRQPRILSIAINESLSFTEAPRFDIYGSHPNKPTYRNVPLQQCGVEIESNSQHIIQVRRSHQTKPFFKISSLSIQKSHNQIVIEDESVKWGLGQRFQEHFHLTDGHWTIWNRDRPWLMDAGLTYESCQTYGHQPLYLAKSDFNSQYHLLYFKNTHGMMVESRRQSAQLVYNSVGGNIHFILVVGADDPEELLERYHSLIGKAHIPPFWSMGYHQSRWGYKSLVEVVEVVDLFESYDIPIDGLWLDLDYMKDKKIFTINEALFPPKQLSQLMKDYKLKLVPLMDVAVAVSDRVPTERGKSMKVFLRQGPRDGQLYRGEVWPGQVYYIDFLHPNASEYWQWNLDRLYRQVQFSGIWLDMNQPTNFRGGQQTFEPFQIQKNENINKMTVSVTTHHYSQQFTLKHAEVHAYYGHLSALPTFQFLKRKGRPFILTRSNSVGTGVFGAHWTGDNVATWEFLKSSINSNFLFQIFGIQMIGSDICGFYLDSNAELCSRWMQLGAFYPFARNHNHERARSQEPYAFGDIHLQTSLLSLKTRYALLKQMYTWLVLKKGKGSFFRPLGFEFYGDEVAFVDFVMESQFLIGKSLMVAPITEPEADSRTVYFPGENESWYEFQIDIDSGSVKPSTIRVYSHQWKYKVYNYLPSPPLTFLRAGFLIFSNYPQTRSNLLSNDFFVFCALQGDRCTGEILGLQDYEDESHLSQCIDQDCRVDLLIRQDDRNGMMLEWVYSGSLPTYKLRVLEFTIASESQVMTYTEEVLISGREGIIHLTSAPSLTLLA